MLIDVAETVAGHDYRAVVNLFLRVDELMADSVFTDMVFDAFMARKREMDRANEAT